MCGICGYYGSGNDKLIQQMIACMRHRGPDGEGSWVEEYNKVGLGMTRLAIIDLISGQQPIFNKKKDIICVYNGEIYNYKKIRERLIRKGHRFTTNSDSEVLVHGYEEYGYALPEYLNGMFAFAIYDSRSKSIFCARDRLGIKPFYYYHANKKFYFASEQKAILKALNFMPDISQRSLMRHLIIGFYTGPYSLFKDIRQLPPGYSLTLSEQKISIRPYWKLSDSNKFVSISQKEAVEQLKKALGRSVKDHLVSDVPVGLTLSGGLDSSILARLMCIETNSNRKNSLNAFTVGYGHSSDEIPYARAISSLLPIKQHEKNYCPYRSIQNLPRIIWHMEEPLSNITAITAYNWSKFISEILKVTLIGEGADEILGGYFQYRIFSGWAKATPLPISRRLFRLSLLQPSLPLIVKLFGGGKKIRREIRNIFHEEYLLPISNGSTGLRGALRFDLEHELSNNQLLRIDRMTMAHGLEARVPYLDHRLVEILWAMPSNLKIRGAIQKYLLRQAFQDVIPHSILDRPKIGIGGSQALFPILFMASLENIMTKILSDKNMPALRWFEPKVISELIHKRCACYPVLGSRARDKLLYILMMFVIWHKIFIENQFSNRTDIPDLNDLFQIQL